MPLRVCTGFEFGPIATLAGLIKGDAGNRIVDNASGSPTVVSSAPVRNGAYVLELNPAGTTEYVQWTTSTLGTSQTRCVTAFAFQFPTSLPTADTLIAEIQVTGATPNLWFRNSDDRLLVTASGNGPGAGDEQTGPVITTGTWYYVELYADCSANPHTLDWWVNGVAQTQSTFAAIAGTLNNVFLSASIAQTMTCRFDDVAIWTDTTDITTPVGQHKVVLLRADSGGTTAQIGTANATGRMVTNSAIDSTHNSANIIAAIRDVPPSGLGTSSATGVGQRTAGTGNAVGIPMETYTLATGETISGLRILVAGWAGTATTNTLGLRSFNGTTEDVLFATANPNFDAVDPCAWLCKIAVDGRFTTQTQLDALVVRLGYSGDISPLPGAHAVYAEVAIAESSLSISPAAVTVSATAGTVTVQGTSPQQDTTPTAVTVTATTGSLTISQTLSPAAVVVTATPGTVAISGTSPTQDLLPAGPTVTAIPGTVALAQSVAPAAVTVTATPGGTVIGQEALILTESFNKADGALGPDLDWQRHQIDSQGVDQWEVVSNRAEITADGHHHDLQVPTDYLAGPDQIVTWTMAAMTTSPATPTGLVDYGPVVHLRFESLNGGADHRAYVLGVGRTNQIFPEQPIIDIVAITLIDTTVYATGGIFLDVIGGNLFTYPITVSFMAAGDQLIAWIIDNDGRSYTLAANDTTLTAGRHIALQSDHDLAVGETATFGIDALRAAAVQVIEPEPVALTATVGDIASVTGGAEVTQHITPLAGDDLIIDSGDTPVPPGDIIDAGDTATPPADIFDANLTVVVVNVTPGTLSIAIVETQAITPQAVTLTATPGSLLVATGPILPAAVTVTALAGVVTVTGGAVTAPTVNLEITVAATRSRAQTEPVSSGTRNRAAATVTADTRSRGQVDDTEPTRLGILVGATRG